MTLLHTQLYVVDDTPYADHWPVRNPPGLLPLPKPVGGLWTSTYDKVKGSEWIQWCLREGWGVPPGQVWDCCLIEPGETLKICEINSFDDLLLIHSKFGRPGSEELTIACGPDLDPIPLFKPVWAHLDFEEMTRHYNAIHLTAVGALETRFTNPGLYGWDCESTVWLRPESLTVRPLGPVRFDPVEEVESEFDPNLVETEDVTGG